MKKAWIGIVFLLALGGMINLSGCKKEKCGCDAETRFNVSDELGNLFVVNKDYAYISTLAVLGRFTLCNPQDIPESLRTMAMERYNPETQSGSVLVYFSGEAKDDCIKLYHQWYYYYYDLVLTDIESAE